LSHVKRWFSELEKQEKLVRRYSDVLFEEHIISKSCDCKGIISTELLDMVKNEK